MIESIDNKRIIEYAKLNTRKYREEMGLFIVEGSHLVEEAIKHHVIKEIFLLQDEENIYEMENVTYVSAPVMKKLSSLDNIPKVLAIVNKLTSNKIEGNVLLLDDISDPGNLGTIIRSCVAFNYQTLILSQNTVDLYNPKVIRATEGMIFNLNIIISDLTVIIPKLKQDNYQIYGTNVINGEIPTKQEYPKHALIIGSEAKGMNDSLISYCDKLLYIKMNQKCESLNAAISASILMYELSGDNIQ